ncbi:MULTISPECIES: SAV_915 family protein [unclassified Streptomyces]|uniref:SAV_915 family protein n=1 Tax=unclassified Streptomyces TaxID=2593676 RepID=UPI0035D7A462
MSERSGTDDPEPLEPGPAGTLFVPVRPGPVGLATGWTARFFRTPLGDRTTVGFTSAHRLAATLGNGQPWIRLSEPALRALGTPLGVTVLTVDPQLTAQAPGRAVPATATARVRRPDPYPRSGPTAATRCGR